MSPRVVCYRLTVWVGLVLVACGDQAPSLPDAGVSPPDAADAMVPLPDMAPDPPAPVPDPFCGDGVVRDIEECDGQDFGGRTCVDEGYYGGQLACRPECKVDASGCAGRCGDGAINGPELCDSALPLTGTCRSRGFLTGTPVCTSSCSLLGCFNGSGSGDEIVLWGRDETSLLGASLAFAGDVDGDGRDDLLATAPGEVRVLGRKGAVYLMYGSTAVRETINDAARFIDDSWGDLVMLEVASARDLDGNGRADFVIAAQTGAAVLDVYLVYGRPEPFTGTLKLAEMVESGTAAQFAIPLTSTMPGRRIALGVPDVTGDGRDDLLLTAPPDANGQGPTYVIPGDPVQYAGTLVLPPPVAPLPLPVHAVIAGSVAEGFFLGTEVTAGDLDGDGVADLLLSSGSDVQVFYGPIEGVLSPTDAAARTAMGPVTSLAVADLDRDGAAELIVAAEGRGHLFRGTPSRRVGALLSGSADRTFDMGGISTVKAGGDIDGDGHPELIIALLPPFAADVEIAAGPILQADSLSFRWALDTVRNPDTGDPLEVALGDFNGDGFDDVALGVPRGDFFEGNHGVVQIVHGATPPAP